MQNLMLMSFLMKKIGVPHGEILSLMNPCSKSSYSRVLRSLSSSGTIRYGGLEIGAIPETKSIANSTSLAGGNRAPHGKIHRQTPSALGSAQTLALIA